MNYLVSVIIPVYKVEAYLDKCIESIISQTHQNLEIILVDDGSPDSCPQKCDDWVKCDPRIKVIHKENAGPGFARNTGLDHASGDCIMFVDADDYLSADAIEMMVKRLAEDKSDMVIAQFVRVYPNQTVQPSAYTWMHDTVISREDALSMIGSTKRQMPVYLWGKIFKKHIFDGLRFSSLKCAEDVYILPHILERCNCVSITDSVAYNYVQRESSIVHTKSKTQIMDSIYASLHVTRFLLERSNLKGASTYYYSAIFQSIELKRDSEAQKLIREAITPAEKSLLRKHCDFRMAIAILAKKYPRAYQLLRSFKKVRK